MARCTSRGTVKMIRHGQLSLLSINHCLFFIFFDFSFTVKAAPRECVIRTGQP